MPDSAWMVRAGNENELAGKLEQHDVVAIGWKELGDVSGLTTRAAVKERYAESRPEESKRRRSQNAGQVYRFAQVIEEGDFVLTYRKSSRTYQVGIVTGPYAYRSDLFEHYPQVRPVEWKGVIERDDLSVAARNSLGSTLTVFQVDSYVDEIESLLSGEKIPEETTDDSDEEAPPFFDEIKAQVPLPRLWVPATA